MGKKLKKGGFRTPEIQLEGSFGHRKYSWNMVSEPETTLELSFRWVSEVIRGYPWIAYTILYYTLLWYSILYCTIS